MLFLNEWIFITDFILIQGSGTGPLESDIDISDEAGLFLGEDSGGPHSGYHGNSGSSMEF